ncbi:hypothetical protein C8J57DRAFT_1271230 [Mycena rebaudengoi]|nr:hypothetical protein C8J57DRAFT_1271230 [Mycena rebaudengoi]
MFSASSAVIALALSSSAYAAIFFTAPTASIGFIGGQPATIKWNDDGAVPSLKDFGLAKASIYAGNSLQQTSLQTISESIDVSTATSLDFTPEKSIGPNGANYFIRFESLSLKDANNAAIPALAFSHIFALTEMTGVFSAEVQAQIDGQSTAPIGGGAPNTNSAGGSSTTSKPSTTASKEAAANSKSASAATKSGAAVPGLVAGSPKLWVGLAVSVVGAVFGATLL